MQLTSRPEFNDCRLRRSARLWRLGRRYVSYRILPHLSLQNVMTLCRSRRLVKKLISGCEVPPQPIRNYVHVDSSSDRPATDQNDLRRMAIMHIKQNRAGTIDLYRRLAKRRPCAGVLPLASLLSFCASCACLPQQPKNAWRPHAFWANYWPRTTRVDGRRLLFPLQSLYASHALN